MPDSYRQGVVERLASEPLKHRVRMGLFRVQQLQQKLRWSRQLSRVSADLRKSVVPVSSLLQPPPYRYANMRGPWVEYGFRDWFLRKSSHTGATYLPIIYDGIYFNSQSQKFSPTNFSHTLSTLESTLASLDPERPYFTILGMYDFQIWNWSSFPRNVVVFSAAGWGDLAIPLLSGHIKYQRTPKDIFLSFMGSLSGPSDLNGVRSRMHEVLKDLAYFGKGKSWKGIMARSIFSLCPRGQARTSFRLFEALSVGSIPIYLWDDREWLPYQDEIDWSEFSISLPIERVRELPALLQEMTPEKIRCMQQRIEELYPRYFTLEATYRWIKARAERVSTVEKARAATYQREI